MESVQFLNNMKKIITLVILAAFLLVGRGNAITYVCSAQLLERADPLDRGSHMCTRETPYFECCTDTTGASCSTPAIVCDPTVGFPLEPCTDVTYDTCVETSADYFENDDGKKSTWVCDVDWTTNPESSHSRWLMCETFLPNTVTAAPAANCKVEYQTEATSGIPLFQVIPVAGVSQSSSFLADLADGGDSGGGSTQSTANSTSYSASIFTSVVNANTGLACAAGACGNQTLKFYLELDSGSLIDSTNEIKINALICEVD